MNNNTKGFTLVELLITLAIFSIITAMAAPSFSSMIERNKLAAEANRIVGNFRLARNEAVKRGGLVTLAGVGSNWKSGFQIYANSDNNVSYDANNDQIIRKESPFATDIAFKSSTNEISFSSNGALSGNNAVTMYLCRTESARRAMEITVNRIGRAESTEITDTSNCLSDQS